MGLGAGCDLGLTGGDPPSRARVVIEGTGTPALDLLTSLDFLTLPDGSLDLGSAVAIPMTLPIDVTFDLLDPPRLFIRGTVPDTTATATLTLQVFLDGERFTNQTGIIGVGGDPSLEFTYRFTRPTI